MRSSEHITERTSAQEALRKGEERFRVLVGSSPNAVVLAAADGSITLVNRQAEAMFGYSREELLGRKVEMLVPERFREHHPSYRAGFVAAPQQRAMGAGRDLFALLKDGSELPVEIGLTPIEMPEGLLTMATIIDITKRKRQEAELARTAAELARSNEDLEQFARVVSHDLQEPLRVINSHLRLVNRRLAEGLDVETRQSVDFVIDAAARMQALIRDILAYSRVGRQGRGFVQTDMEAVVRFAISDLAVSIEKCGASIQYGRLPTVTADSTLMLQLLQNLLGNAIKYCAEGNRPEITVGAREERGGWLFWVKDNGIGIDPEDAQRIFQMFQRLHARGEYPGTGIGLSICKKIVEYHGGRIWVESRVGEGSTFFFTIPERP